MTDSLENNTLHNHLKYNEWVTRCLVCGKLYEQVIEETVADHLQQAIESSESVRDRQLKTNAFQAGLQSGAISYIPRGVSQAAACGDSNYKQF